MTSCSFLPTPYPGPAGVALIALAWGFASLSVYLRTVEQRALGVLRSLLPYLVFTLLSILFFNYTVDDAWISLRYALNAAQGHNLVLNPGESPRIEGYTNFLYVLRMVPLYLTGISDSWILFWMKVSGIVFGYALLWATGLLARELTSRHDIASYTMVFLACVPQLALWAVGGLETTQYLFLLVAALARFLVEQRRKRNHLWSFGLLFLVSLTRPEGSFFTLGLIVGVLLLASLFRETEPRRLARRLLPGVLLFFILTVLFFFWRYLTYQQWLPNTFYAKTGGGQAEAWGFLRHVAGRLHEMLGFLAYLLSLGLFALPGIVRAWRTNRVGVATIIGSSVLLFGTAFVARVEWMPGFRYELPIIPFFLIFAAIGFVYLLEQLKSRWLNVATAGLLFALILYPAIEYPKAMRSTQAIEIQHIALGKWLHKHAPKESMLAAFDMGATPYYSKLDRVMDINQDGLLNPHTIRHGYDTRWMLAQEPSFLVLVPQDSERYSHNAMQLFYATPEFLGQYRHLVTLDDYLAVYARKGVPISDDGLEELREIEATSSDLPQPAFLRPRTALGF